MDPVTILSTIGTCMSIAKLAVSGLHSLCELKQKYDDVDLSVNGIVFKLQSIEFSLSLLENWARDGEGRDADAKLVKQLELSIQSCVAVISGIHAKATAGAEATGTKDKPKLPWNENTARDFERDLDSQITAFHFLLTTTQFTGSAQREKLQNPEARTVFNKARDVASVYELDALTINEGAEDLEFDFDNEIVNSAAYLSAESWVVKAILQFAVQQEEFGNASSWDQASTIAPSEATQESKDKKKRRWSFVPLAKTISENAQAKKEHAQLQEKLCTAASKGDLMLVQELVECGADPAEKRKKNHCLLNAIEAGSTDVVKFLLKHGADPNSHDYESGLACLGAVFYKHPENTSMLSTLLEYGADTKDWYDIGDKQYKETSAVGNIFHLCAYFFDEIPNVVAIAKLFLEYNTESLDEYRKTNGQKAYTPLQLACQYFEPGASENNERLKALIAAYIAKGACIHEPFGKKVKIGATDIFIEFCSDEVDHHDLIKFLLDQGANPNVSNTAEGLETSPLHHACMAGLVETARVLVEHGAAVDAKSFNGVRPLHCAVSYKYLELVSLLIDHGADLEATTTKEGMTPLLLACEDPNTPLSIIERLVAANADVEAFDQNKMTPLLFVCGSRKEVVEYLVDSGANIEARGGQANSPPLHQAAACNNDAVVKYLVQKGANLTSTDDRGETAVHRACMMCALDALRVLIAKGADVNAEDTTDDTPLHIVIEYWVKGDENLVEIIEFLLASGANPQAKNDEDLSPLEVLERSVDIPSSQKRKVRGALKSEYQP